MKTTKFDNVFSTRKEGCESKSVIPCSFIAVGVFVLGSLILWTPNVTNTINAYINTLLHIAK